MNRLHTTAAVALFASIVFVSQDAESLFARGGGGRGGGGGRPGGGVGGGARPSGPVGGGNISRPAGPVGGGNVSRPSGGGISGAPSINRSPSVSTPNVGGGRSAPNIGNAPLSSRGGPGVVTQPKVQPGNRPDIGSRPNVSPKTLPVQPKGGPIGKGIGDPGIGKKGIDINPKNGPIGKGIGDPGIGSKGIDPKGGIGSGNFPAYGRPGVGDNRPGAGQRPSVLPGLGSAAIGGAIGAGAADRIGRRQEIGDNRQQNIADRSQNLQDRLDQREDFRQDAQGNRQDFRQQNQDNRQDYRTDRREDWQNWHDDYYGHHNDWYHGGWCDHWGDYWSHMWSDHTAAMVLGTTMWGINRMGYWFGTSNYSNPYYTEPLVVGSTTVNYAEPLVAVPPTVNGEPAPSNGDLPPVATPAGMKDFDAAQAAFLAGDYPKALTLANQAVAAMPKDAVVHEFRALVLFALGKYKDAAATLHPVLAVGPGWDWTTMSSLYPDSDTYTKQLRALENYVNSNPDAPDGHFLLAYHYLCMGHDDAAAKQLQQVQRLLPNDTVSGQLLTMMGKGPKASERPPEPQQVKIDAAQLVGTWTAGQGKSSFEMTLDNDKSFTWTYRDGKKEQVVKGVYAIDGATLAMEPDAGGVMLADISAPQGGSFTFKEVGAPAAQNALKFQKK